MQKCVLHQQMWHRRKGQMIISHQNRQNKDSIIDQNKIASTSKSMAALPQSEVAYSICIAFYLIVLKRSDTSSQPRHKRLHLCNKNEPQLREHSLVNSQTSRTMTIMYLENPLDFWHSSFLQNFHLSLLVTEKLLG